MGHECNQEKQIGELVSKIELITKEFYGNGREGMITIVPRLETKINSIADSIAAQATLISALTKTITETTAVEQFKDKSFTRRTISWQTASLFIAGIMSIGIAVAAYIFKK